MSISVNRIPSISVPFTDKEGRISPIWHEFLRAFVSSTIENEGGGSGDAINVLAGAGLTGGGPISSSVTLNAGAGVGITINADDINVDIANQTHATATLEDEVMISRPSNNNAIRKTKVRDIAALASNPGGSTSQIQYNDRGVFNGDTGFTTDGNGTVTITSLLNTNEINLTGSGTIIRFDSTTALSAPRIQSIGGGGYLLCTSTVSLNNGQVQFLNTPDASSNVIRFLIGPSGSMVMGDNVYGGSGIAISALPFRRGISASVTAHTTQTQGNEAQINDYCNVTTVANANDVITMPAALSGRWFMVRNSGANILQIFPASGDNLGEGVNISSTLLPGSVMSWLATDTTNWYTVNGPVRYTLAATITASTTQTQGQQPLTRDVNEISVVANANDTVTLPTAPSYSRAVVIINNGANTLRIFPASGDNLGAGLNTATTLASGSNVRYTNYDATNWEAI